MAASSGSKVSLGPSVLASSSVHDGQETKNLVDCRFQTHENGGRIYQRVQESFLSGVHRPQASHNDTVGLLNEHLCGRLVFIIAL